MVWEVPRLSLLTVRKQGATKATGIPLQVAWLRQRQDSCVWRSGDHRALAKQEELSEFPAICGRLLAGELLDQPRVHVHVDDHVNARRVAKIVGTMRV
jgi:hypothetical protein